MLPACVPGLSRRHFQGGQTWGLRSLRLLTQRLSLVCCPPVQTVLHEAFSALAALSKDQNKYKALLTDLLVQVRACLVAGVAALVCCFPQWLGKWTRVLLTRPAGAGETGLWPAGVAAMLLPGLD